MDSVVREEPRYSPMRAVYEEIPTTAIGEGLLVEKLKMKGVEERDVKRILNILLEGGLIWCRWPHMYTRWEGSE